MNIEEQAVREVVEATAKGVVDQVVKWTAGAIGFGVGLVILYSMQRKR